MCIAVHEVTHWYQAGTPWQVRALSDVNLRVEKGQVVAVMGATGSGKSTLAQILAGVVRPSAGTVYFGDEDFWAANKAHQRQLRRRVGLVFQNAAHQLFEATVRDDIAFGPRSLGLEPGDIQERVEWAASVVGLEPTLLDMPPRHLSGGQRRWAALAGVLAMKPEVLILDEPAAGLDPLGRRRLLGLLRSLNEQYGMALVMVSHNPDEVAWLAHRVVVLDQGRVVLDDTTQAVFAQGEYLQRLGLDLPLPVLVAQKLARRGWPGMDHVISMDELVRAVASVLDRRRDQTGGPPS